MRHQYGPCKVLIFDWDDTICPSSFVDRYQIDDVRELPLDLQRLFSDIAKHAARCLEEASRYGEVIIITNSDDGWVKFSAERFVPDLLPVIGKYRVVSARTRYERFYPNQPLCWKAAAFAHEVNEIYEAVGGCDRSCESLALTDVSSTHSKDLSFTAENGLREIISFGDSMEERTAVRIVSGQLTSVPKSVLFVHSPSPRQLIGQLFLLTGHMKYICEQQCSLDLEISPSQADRCADRVLKDDAQLPTVVDRERLGTSADATLRDAVATYASR